MLATDTLIETKRTNELIPASKWRQNLCLEMTYVRNLKENAERPLQRLNASTCMRRNNFWNENENFQVLSARWNEKRNVPKSKQVIITRI